MTPEQKLQQDIKKAAQRYRDAERENIALDEKIAGLQQAKQHICSAREYTDAARTAVYQSRFDSPWKGRCRTDRNNRSDELNGQGNDLLKTLDDLIDAINARISTLNGQKDVLGQIMHTANFLIENAQAELAFLASKAGL